MPLLSSRTRSAYRISEAQHEKKDPKLKNNVIRHKSLNPGPPSFGSDGKISRDGHDVQDSNPQDGLDNNPVTRVLPVLAKAPLDIVHTFDNFTRDDYAKLLEALAEQKPPIRIKLFYLYDQQTLLSMSPSSLHECIFTTLVNVIGEFTSAIGHDKDIHKIITPLNKRVNYRGPLQLEDEVDMRRAIPDFQLMIEVNEDDRRPRTVLKWVGEVAFTTSVDVARDRLKGIITAKPSVDLALLVIIDESPKWESPGSDNPLAQRLRAEPFIEYDDFDPIMESLGPVVLGGITWTSLSQVAVEAYIRSPEDGTLTVNENYLTRGLLYPSLEMGDIDNVLIDASKALKSSLLSVMESGTGEHTFIERVRESEAVLRVSWTSVIRSMRTAVMDTAYERYVQWYMTAAKRKFVSGPKDSGSSKRAKRAV